MLVSWALETFSGEIDLIVTPLRKGMKGRSVEGLGEEKADLVQRFSCSEDHQTTLNYCQDTIGFFLACFSKLQ